MTFKLHKDYCTSCQSGLFCDEGLALLSNRPYTQPEVEEGIKEIEKEIEVKKITDARHMTKKQAWRLYKKKIKKDQNKVGVVKFKRN